MKSLTRRHFIKNTKSLALFPFLYHFKERPQLILYNGNFITIDPDMPSAESVAIGNGRFLAVGKNSEVLSLAGPWTIKVNLGGKSVTPGFIDAHSHPGGAGRSHLVNVDCDLRSIEDIKNAIRERASKTPKGEWVFGFKYDDTKTKEGRFVTRQDLDEAAPDHPVIINHRGGHTDYVNSLAFKFARIDESTPDPLGGAFARDADGKLTGRNHGDCRIFIP